jgi:hypothetical protein
MPARRIDLTDQTRVGEDYFIVYRSPFQLRPKPGQPLSGVLDLAQAWVGVFLEVEEFLVLL